MEGRRLQGRRGHGSTKNFRLQAVLRWHWRVRGRSGRCLRTVWCGARQRPSTRHTVTCTYLEAVPGYARYRSRQGYQPERAAPLRQHSGAANRANRGDPRGADEHHGQSLPTQDDGHSRADVGSPRRAWQVPAVGLCGHGGVRTASLPSGTRKSPPATPMCTAVRI